MDELLSAVERLHALGASEVELSTDEGRVNLRVVFGGAPSGDLPEYEPLTEDERQAAFERLAYHSS